MRFAHAAYAPDMGSLQIIRKSRIETALGLRLAKEKASMKIDSTVALAMAVHAALQAGPERPSFAVIMPDGGDRSWQNGFYR
jgi:hypothetical protein